MKTFEGLKHGDKLRDKSDGMIVEYYEWDSDKYIATAKSLFALFQFDPKDFDPYHGDLAVGDIDKEYLSKMKLGQSQ